MKHQPLNTIKDLNTFDNLVSKAFAFDLYRPQFKKIKNDVEGDKLKQSYIKSNYTDSVYESLVREFDFYIANNEPSVFIPYLQEVSQYLHNTEIFDRLDEMRKDPELELISQPHEWEESFDQELPSMYFIIPQHRVVYPDNYESYNNGRLNYDTLSIVCDCISSLYDDLLSKVNELIKSNRPKNEFYENVVLSQIDPIILERINHKLILLDELGILSCLLEKHEILKKDRDTSLAKLLYTFFEDPDKDKKITIDTLRKGIASLLSSNGDYDIRTAPAMKKVEAELIKVGIKLKD